MQFITYRPNVVLIDMNGKTHLVRKAETLETVTMAEQVPPHLVSERK
jgi:diaminopimelate decarboxylase